MLFLFPPSLGELRARARAELLGSALSRRIGEDVHVDVAKDYEELERSIENATAEVAWAPPLVWQRSRRNARHVLKAVRAGRSDFRAALVCRAQEPFDLAWLGGKRAAWVDPMSASGYQLPLAWLRAKGFDPERGFSTQAFKRSFRDALMAVVVGDADVASVYCHGTDPDDARSSLVELLGGVAGSVRAVATTHSSPTDALVITNRLSPERARELVEVIAPFRSNSSAPALLREICNAEGFETAPD